MELKKEIEFLLKELKKYNWGRKEIEAEFEYNSNYISQALSRGGNVKLLNHLKKLHQRVTNTEVEYNVGAAIRQIQAVSDVTLLAIAELLAKANGKPVASVVGDLEDLVKRRLNEQE